MQKTILIVEDELTLREALEQVFTRAGYKVVGVEDGIHGLEQALSLHPSVIISDVIMPNLGGVDFLAKLRADYWGRHVPVVILTNAAFAEHSERFEKDHYLRALVKADTGLAELEKIVAEIINKKEEEKVAS